MIGNELFACFESTDTKSRLNFLQVLHGCQRLYAINDITVAYWKSQGLTAALVEQLQQGPQAFADESAWQTRLTELAITSDRHVRMATEGALLGGLIARGVSPQLVVLSDGARSSTSCSTPPAGFTRNGPWRAWCRITTLIA